MPNFVVPYVGFAKFTGHGENARQLRGRTGSIRQDLMAFPCLKKLYLYLRPCLESMLVLRVVLEALCSAAAQHPNQPTVWCTLDCDELPATQETNEHLHSVSVSHLRHTDRLACINLAFPLPPMPPGRPLKVTELAIQLDGMRGPDTSLASWFDTSALQAIRLWFFEESSFKILWTILRSAAPHLAALVLDGAEYVPSLPKEEMLLFPKLCKLRYLQSERAAIAPFFGSIKAPLLRNLRFSYDDAAGMPTSLQLASFPKLATVEVDTDIHVAADYRFYGNRTAASHPVFHFSEQLRMQGVQPRVHATVYGDTAHVALVYRELCMLPIFSMELKFPRMATDAHDMWQEHKRRFPYLQSYTVYMPPVHVGRALLEALWDIDAPVLEDIAVWFIYESGDTIFPSLSKAVAGQRFPSLRTLSMSPTSCARSDASRSLRSACRAAGIDYVEHSRQ